MDLNKICVGCMDNDTGDEVCPKCGAPFELSAKNTLQMKPRTILRDQYLIGRALGHGGFGITYLAWDIGLETKLAVKEYMPNGVAGRASGETKVLAYSEATKQEFEWGLDRFLEEARTLKKFSKYPGIVSVDTIFRENGTAYLVMEHLDGWTFEDFLKKRGGKVSPETALRILLPVIDALGPVHAEGILHRDISPDNIYLTRAGKVKVIDFGAARNALGQKSRNLSIILKEGYAPEEQYRASGIQGPWTDVYATGATLYHSITGQIPQPALDRLAEDKLERPSAMGVDIEPGLEAALLKSLAVKASERFQSMEDFRAALSGEMPVAPLPPSPSIILPPPPVQPQPPQSSIQPPVVPPPAPISYAPPVPAPASAAGGRPRWMIPAAVAVAAAVVIGVVISRQPTPPAPGPSGASGSIATGGTGSLPTGPTGFAPTGPTGNPTGPTGNPTGPPGEPTGATGSYREPSGATGSRPTGATGGRRTEPTGATGAPYQPTGPTGSTGAPYTEPTGPTGTTPPGPSGGGDYDSMIEQAKTAWSQRRYQQVAQILMQAIRSDPTKPRAYSGLAELQLYILGDLGGAMQNYQQAVARGGDAVFHVLHDHSAETFVAHCQGFLYVSRKGVRFVPSDSNHGFTAVRADVREVRSNRKLNFSFGRQTRPSIDPHAFHIKLANGQNYNFAPMSRFTEEERNLILGMLGGN